MSIEIALITFDLDDTLWDTRPALEKAEAAQWQFLENRFPKLHLRELTQHQLVSLRQRLLAVKPHLTHQISQFREQFILMLLDDLGVNNLEAEAAAKAAFEAFLKERHNVALYEDAAPILRKLGQNYRLGALTNGNADVYKTELGKFFNYAWRAEQFGFSKPDPRLFQKVFKLAGVTPQQVVHIGDCHDNDVTGAIQAGAAAIWINSAGDSSPIANATARKLSELPQIMQLLSR